MGRGGQGPTAHSPVSACPTSAGSEAVQGEAQAQPSSKAYLQISRERYGDRVTVHCEDPLIFTIANFLSDDECDALIDSSDGRLARAPVVGKGQTVNSFGYVQGESAGRTSTTCTLAKSEVPWYVERIEELTGLPRTHQEAPQVGRYEPGQRFNSHFDAVEPNSDIGRKFLQNGGQRICTVLSYLNTPDPPKAFRRGRGGHTTFRSMGVSVEAVKGTVLVFFPAYLDGSLDKRTLHSGDPPRHTPKWVSQVWVRQSGNRRDAAPSRRFCEGLYY